MDRKYRDRDRRAADRGGGSRQIYAITGSSAYVGLTGLFGLVPLVIFGLYGGSIADAFDKRKVLITTTFGMIITTAMFLGLSAAGNENVWLLLGAFSLQQTFFAVNQPTRTAVFRSILPMELLPAGSSLNMMLMQAGAIIGPLLAGVLIPFTGFTLLYLLDVVLLLPTLIAVFTLPVLRRTGEVMKAGLASVVGGPRLADVLHGWAAAPFGVGWATLLGGVAVVVLTVLLLVAAPAFRRYQRPGPREINTDTNPE